MAQEYPFNLFLPPPPCTTTNHIPLIFAAFHKQQINFFLSIWCQIRTWSVSKKRESKTEANIMSDKINDNDNFLTLVHSYLFSLFSNSSSLEAEPAFFILCYCFCSLSSHSFTHWGRRIKNWINICYSFCSF